MELSNAETMNIVAATMNKHSLYYHTRLHDWYRQHSIMQEKHSCRHNTDVPPPSLVASTGHLTADKLNFINDWCSEVNKMFFPTEKKKAPKPTGKSRQRKQCSYSKDVSKPTDGKPVGTLDAPAMTDKRNSNTKSFTQYTRLPATAVVKAHRPCVGLADKRKNTQYPKKTALSNVKAGKLDLCIINSTKEAGDDGTRFGHNFFTTRKSQLKHTHNDKRFSAQLKNSTVSGSLVGTDNIYGYYGFISAIVRNVALYNDNRRRVENNVNDEAPNQQAMSNIRDEHIQHKLSTSRRESFWEPRNGNVSLQQAQKTNIDEKQKASPSLSVLQDGVRSDDNATAVTSVSCVDRTQPGNNEHVRNIDQRQSGRSVIENKQDNAPNQISDKENSSNLSTVLAENESIHSITGVMKNEINYTNAKAFSTQAHSTENILTSIEKHPSMCNEVKTIGLEKFISDTDISFQNSIKENETNSEAKTNETHKQSTATIGKEARLHGWNTKDDKQDHMCDLTNEATGRVSCFAVNDCDKDEVEFCTRDKTPTIGHFCLSNNLLNMLTIDDCKISQRYSLLKTGDSAKEDVKTSKSVQDEVKEASNKVITENSKDAGKMKPHLSQSIRASSTTIRSNRTTNLENGAISFHGFKCSTNLEKGFHVLINNKLPMQRTDQRKSKDGKNLAGVVKKTEGPIYRCLHAALRKQIEELRPNKCAKLQQKDKFIDKCF